MKDEAEQLNEQGRSLLDAGDLDGALDAFGAATRLDPDLDSAWFNMGLVHKSRHEWEEAARCNRRAAALARVDQQEPAWWNLGIAATALRDWATAREAWGRYGIAISPGEGPIEEDFGLTPVRVDPGGSSEVVWCRRIDPARAVVLNVPFPESGHRCGDVVLHDGVPHGERVVDGRTFSVFDELERWAPSPTPTLKAAVVCSSPSDSDALSRVFGEADLTAEDWRMRVRILCEACSTGRAHSPEEDHEEPEGWSTERIFGIAAEVRTAERLLAGWQAAAPSRRSILSVETVL